MPSGWRPMIGEREPKMNWRTGNDVSRLQKLAPLESAQYAPETLCDVSALQRFVQHFPDTDRTRTLGQWSPAVAAHQYDRDVGPQQSNLTGEIGADELRHRLIGQDDIEALRCLAESLQRR